MRRKIKSHIGNNNICNLMYTYNQKKHELFDLTDGSTPKTYNPIE